MFLFLRYFKSAAKVRFKDIIKKLRLIKVIKKTSAGGFFYDFKIITFLPKRYFRKCSRERESVFHNGAKITAHFSPCICGNIYCSTLGSMI